MLRMEAQRAANLAIAYAAAGKDLPEPEDQYRRVVRVVLSALEKLPYSDDAIALDAALIAADTLLMFASRNVKDPDLAGLIDTVCDALDASRGRECS